MKTFQQHLFDVVSERKGDSPDSIEMCEEAAKRYATAAIKEHLSRAAENATKFRDLEDESTHDLYDTIAETDIKLS